jgi:hypothetical protein
MLANNYGKERVVDRYDKYSVRTLEALRVCRPDRGRGAARDLPQRQRRWLLLTNLSASGLASCTNFRRCHIADFRPAGGQVQLGGDFFHLAELRRQPVPSAQAASKNQ